MDDVLVVEYDLRWPDLFVQEAERVRAVLGEVIAIEHFGSTSVPGLAAKPILDLLIKVRSLEKARHAVPALAELGYAVPRWNARARIATVLAVVFAASLTTSALAWSRLLDAYSPSGRPVQGVPGLVLNWVDGVLPNGAHSDWKV